MPQKNFGEASALSSDAVNNRQYTVSSPYSWAVLVPRHAPPRPSPAEQGAAPGSEERGTAFRPHAKAGVPCARVHVRACVSVVQCAPCGLCSSSLPHNHQQVAGPGHPGRAPACASCRAMLGGAAQRSAQQSGVSGCSGSVSQVGCAEGGRGRSRRRAAGAVGRARRGLGWARVLARVRLRATEPQSVDARMYLKSASVRACVLAYASK